MAVGVVRTPAGDDIAARLMAIEAEIAAWLDRYEPDAVAVERVFSQHNVRTVMGTAQASAVAMLAAAQRGLPVALHTPSEVKAAVTGNGRADKAQVGAMVTRLLRLDRAAQARRRRRRPGAGHLPPVARAQCSSGMARAARRRAGRPMIATVRGRVAAVSLDSAVIEVGGVGILVHAAPGTLAELTVGQPAQLSTSLVVREDSLTLFGFLTDDERSTFELVQTVSGIGPRLALAMLAVHEPDGLRRAVATDDLVALTRVPGIGRKGAQRLVLELKDRLGPPGRTPQETAAPAADRRPTADRRCVTPWSASAGRSKPPTTRSTRSWRPPTQSAPAPADIAGLLRAALRQLGRP